MRFILTLVASLALVACGGSGSDDNANSNGGGNTDTSTNPGNPGNPGPLTSANYVAAAQAVLATNAYLLDAGSMFLGVETSDSNVLLKFGQDRINKLSYRAAAPAQAVGVVEVDEEICENSNGKTVVEYNDANNNGIEDKGDSITYNMQSCAFAGAILNGQAKLLIDNTTGDIDSYPHTISATVIYNNLGATVAGVTTTGNGSASFSVKMPNEYLQEITLRAPSFTVTTVADGKTSSQTMKNYDVSLTIRESGNQIIYTSSLNGTLLDSNFGTQFLTVKTTQPLVRMSNQPYAQQGEILITDNTKAKVRAKVANATTVSIELDEDGNGTYETSVNKLWSDLL